MHQVDKDQYEKVLRYIDIGKREGATLVTGGKPCGDNKGYYIEPTIFTDVKVKRWHSPNQILFSIDIGAKTNKILTQTFLTIYNVHSCRTT